MLLFRIYLATSSKVSLCKMTKLRWSTLVINEKQIPEHMSDISSLSRVLTNTFPENFGKFHWENVKLRSSRPEAFCEKGVLRNFTKFTRKHLCQRLWHRCFPVNFVKFLRTPFLTEHLWWLLLKNVKVVSKIFSNIYRMIFEERPRTDTSLRERSRDIFKTSANT